MFYFAYVPQSEKDTNFYVGYSNDLRKRLEMHNEGRVQSTMHRRPFQLVYFEGCKNQQDATRREKYLKSSWGKRYIKSRLNKYLTR